MAEPMELAGPADLLPLLREHDIEWSKQWVSQLMTKDGAPPAGHVARGRVWWRDDAMAYLLGHAAAVAADLQRTTDQAAAKAAGTEYTEPEATEPAEAPVWREAPAGVGSVGDIAKMLGWDRVQKVWGRLDRKDAPGPVARLRGADLYNLAEAEAFCLVDRTGGRVKVSA